jgi:tetratricopeptide (TPR) repeat protein
MHANAAMGWLDLGNCVEAQGELDRIDARLRVHPQVLDIRWLIYRKAGKDDACRDLAETLLKTDPDSPMGWIRTAQNLYYAGRYQEAYEILAPVEKRYAGFWMVQYDLACYAARMNRFEEAKDRLKKAFGMDRSGEVRNLSLRDPDFEKFWQEIGEWE